MTNHPEDGTERWEARINALLEGELDPAQAEALKSEASENQRLATAIIEAYQLQRAMENVTMERAPAGLRRKLRRIPRENRPLYLRPRWAVALAAVPLVVASLVLLQSEEPSAAQIEQARQELATAFAYIERVGDRARDHVEQEVGGELKDAVGESVIRSLPKFKSDTQEKQA